MKAKSATIKTFQNSPRRSAKDVLGCQRPAARFATSARRTRLTDMSRDARLRPAATLAARAAVHRSDRPIASARSKSWPASIEKKFTIAGSYPSIDKNKKAAAVQQRGPLARSRWVICRSTTHTLVEKGVDVANPVNPDHRSRAALLKIANADGSLPKDFDVNSGKGKLGGITDRPHDGREPDDRQA